jgi:L-lactate dehydrogenase
MLSRKVIGIVGAGQVGIASAFTIFQQRIASELWLVDLDQKRAEGEAMDLEHGQAYVGRCHVHAGSFKDLAEAQIIVVTAGASQKPGESRLDLLARNARIFSQITAELDQYAPEALVLVASNPVDILTCHMQNISKRPAQRIIGTGTMLDTTRFRTLLGEYYSVDPRSVHAFILGEHGDSEVPIWSSADIGGTPLVQNTIMNRIYDKPALDAIFQNVKKAASEIINRKGYTNWAIALVIAHLIRTILEDQNSILPVSVRPNGEYGFRDICLSIPAAVGINGIVNLAPPKLAEQELEALGKSAAILKQNQQSITKN